MNRLMNWLPKDRAVGMILAVAMLQTAVLAYIVFDRVRLIKTGREIVLPIVPVDPRDFFRGDYVRLGYDISRVPSSMLEGPLPGRNDPFYVVLQKDAAGAWKPVKLTARRTEDSTDDRVVLKGRSQFGRLVIDPTRQTTQAVRYGIESYFVPQGQGLDLEKLATEKKLAARIAVDRRGNAAIKGLVVDGVPRYEEPLF